MSNVDEDKLNLTNVRFPNGVTFRRAEAWDGNYIFFCNDCDKAGVSWNYTVSREEMATSYPYEGKQHFYSSLYKHAELHNPLCKRLEKMLIAKSPIYKVDGHFFYSDSDINMELPTIEEIKKKKKPRRMIRLR
jgi:hypothetical protein